MLMCRAYSKCSCSVQSISCYHLGEEFYVLLGMCQVIGITICLWRCELVKKKFLEVNFVVRD